MGDDAITVFVKDFAVNSATDLLRMSVRDIQKSASSSKPDINEILEKWCMDSELCLKRVLEPNLKGEQDKNKRKAKELIPLPPEKLSGALVQLPSPEQRPGTINLLTAEKRPTNLPTPEQRSRNQSQGVKMRANLPTPEQSPGTLGKAPSAPVNLPTMDKSTLETPSVLSYEKIRQGMVKKVNKWIETKTTGDKPLVVIKKEKELKIVTREDINKEVQ